MLNPQLVGKMLLLLTLCLFCMTSFAAAKDINLAWDASPGPNVSGYKLYYQSDSATLPLEGFEAIEGNSPIDVGNANSLSLTGLPDGRVYYVAVSAYNAEGVESVLSNIVASDWVPELIAPVNGAADESATETFIWSTAPQGYDVTYTLYYGTDPELIASAAPIVTNFPQIKVQPGSPLTILILLGLTYTLVRCSRKTFAVGAMALVIGFSLTGCGGGGSTALDAPISSPADPILTSPATSVLPKGTSDYHEAYNLEPATTYYWKVVAQDDSNQKYESVTNSFTTADL